MKRRRRISRRSHGFTLVEALATLALLAIVLPAVNQAISTAGGLASDARRRDEASGLAQAKLSEVIATGQWQSGNLSGDFGTDWPEYHWEAALLNWSDTTSGASTNATMEELALRVTWTNPRGGGKQDSVTVSTLVYQRPTASSTTTP